MLSRVVLFYVARTGWTSRLCLSLTKLCTFKRVLISQQFQLLMLVLNWSWNRVVSHSLQEDHQVSPVFFRAPFIGQCVRGLKDVHFFAFIDKDD
jgi:hypothetical protein